MNVEIVTKAVQVPEKEYINGIFVAVYRFPCTLSVNDDRCFIGSQTFPKPGFFVDFLYW